MQKLETKAKKEELNYEKLVVHEEHFEKNSSRRGYFYKQI